MSKVVGDLNVSSKGMNFSFRVTIVHKSLVLSSEMAIPLEWSLRMYPYKLLVPYYTFSYREIRLSSSKNLFLHDASANAPADAVKTE